MSDLAIQTQDMKSKKKEIRKRIMLERGRLTPEQISSKSAMIVEKLMYTGLISDDVKQNQHILLYMDFRNEVMTEPLIRMLWSMGKTVYIPWVDFATHVMTIHKFSSFDELVVSSYGIKEPNPAVQPAEPPEVIELILSPGVAFNRSCYRMGYGGGFYDRFLANLAVKPPVVALAFELQMCEDLPVEDHDVQLDMVITEENLYQK